LLAAGGVAQPGDRLRATTPPGGELLRRRGPGRDRQRAVPRAPDRRSPDAAAVSRAPLARQVARGLRRAFRRPAGSAGRRARARNAADAAALPGVSNRAAAAPVRLARGADMTSSAATAARLPDRRYRVLIDAHFRGEVPPGGERRMRLHLVDCADCRAYYDRHLRLALVDPQAALPANERLA